MFFVVVPIQQEETLAKEKEIIHILIHQRFRPDSGLPAPLHTNMAGLKLEQGCLQETGNLTKKLL